ncbi:unnamed protein product [Camellia sinensis]
MQNLEVLEVKDCRSIGVAFDLEGLVWEDEIEVTECGMMKSIIGNEPNADDTVITNMIMFPQLSSLKLSDLPNLSSFFFEACTFEGLLLKTIEVINCPKMKILPSVFQRKLDQQKADFSTSSQHHLLDGKFIFSYWSPFNFGKLTIIDVNGSIEMWHNQLEVDRLDKVRFMLVQFCGKLSNVISSNLIQRLRYLQRLKVWWCDSLETIFDLQGSVRAGTTGIGNCKKIEKIVTREEEEEDGDDERGKISIFSVELENLPNLVCIGIPKSQIHISKLRVDFCPKYRA